MIILDADKNIMRTGSSDSGTSATTPVNSVRGDGGGRTGITKGAPTFTTPTGASSATNVIQQQLLRSPPRNGDGSLNYVAMARNLTAQPWATLGLELDSVTASAGLNKKSAAAAISAIERTVIDNIVALLLVRVVALVSTRNSASSSVSNATDMRDPVGATSSIPFRKQGKSDVSSSTVATGGSSSATLGGGVSSSAAGTWVDEEERCSFVGALPTSDELPEEITVEVIDELQSYVSYMAKHYRSVHYHCFEHCYHVTLSANKLLDMLLRDDDDCGGGDIQQNREDAPDRPSLARKAKKKEERAHETFGLSSDPISQLAVVFSALIHDVDHRGITNQQLVLEADELAIMYNDQSVAEQRSISLAFCELMRTKPGSSSSSDRSSSRSSGTAPMSSTGGSNTPEDEVNASATPPPPPKQYVYGSLMKTLFGSTDMMSPEYTRFRRTVIDMVLSTDIASPERIQVSKSKYKAAFGSSAGRSRGVSPTRPGSVISGGQSTSQVGRVVATSPNVMRPQAGERRDSEDTGDMTPPPPAGTRKPSLRERFLDTRRSTHGADLQRGIHVMLGSSSPAGLGSPGGPMPPPPPAVNVDFATTSNGLPSMGTYSRSPSDTSASSLDGDDEGDEEHDHQVGKGTLTVAPTADLETTWQVGASIIEEGRRSTTASGRSSRRSSAANKNRRGSGATTGGSVKGICSRHISQRRFSAPVIHHPTHEFRLGIRRALNLTGSTVGLFPKTSKPPHLAEQDEDVELKASVVLELIIKAADVGPIMQGWDNYFLWSKKLFFEQKEACLHRRGADPVKGWFNNQITFFDSYGMPLAKRLREVNVFGSRRSEEFASNILENRRRWLEEGQDRVEQLVREWEEYKEQKIQEQQAAAVTLCCGIKLR